MARAPDLGHLLVPRSRWPGDPTSRSDRTSTLRKGRDAFLRKLDAQFELVRVPTDDPVTARSVESVPPEELDNAVYWMVSSAHSISPTDLRLHAARLFGWGRTGPDISAAIEEAVDRM